MRNWIDLAQGRTSLLPEPWNLPVQGEDKKIVSLQVNRMVIQERIIS